MVKNYSGIFFGNENNQYCTFLDLGGVYYYEAVICLENGPRQNIFRRFTSEEISQSFLEKKLKRIEDEESKNKVTNFLEKHRDGNEKYRVFWKEFEEIKF